MILSAKCLVENLRRREKKKRKQKESVVRAKLFGVAAIKPASSVVFLRDLRVSSGFARDLRARYSASVSAAGYACENCHGEGNLFGIELSDSDLRQPSNSIFRFDARPKGLNSELRGLGIHLQMWKVSYIYSHGEKNSTHSRT